MPCKWGRVLGLLFCTILFLPAQTTQGVISGRVADSDSGEPVAGAAVRVTNVASEAVYIRVTGRGGDFTFPLLSPGTYRVRVEAGDRYQAQELHNLELPVSEDLELRFKLRPRADVWEQAQHRSVFLPDQSLLVFFGPDVDTSRTGSFQANGGRRLSLETSISTVVDPREVRELPLAGRDIYTMILTQPGVTASTTTNRGLGFSVNGQRPSSANFLLDGVENNNYLTTGPLAAVAPEAIQEYRLSISNFGAEYGGTAGVLANAVTASGGAAWHGLGYLYANGGGLNANDFQRNANRLGRLPQRQVQPGFRVTGPLVRERLFGSAAAEWLRFRSEEDPVEYRLPTRLFVPAGTVAARLMNEFVPPGFGNPSGPVANVRLAPRTSLDRVLLLPRIDIVPSVRHRLYARAAVSRFTRPDLTWSPYTEFNVPLRQNVANAAVGWTAEVNPSLVNELRAGAGFERLGIERPHGEVPLLATGDGVTLPGAGLDYDFRSRDRNFEWSDALTWTAGAHIVKAGGRFLRRAVSTSLSYGANGRYTFPTLDAFGSDQPSLVNFVIVRPPRPLPFGGVPAAIAVPDPQRDYGYSQYAFFAQDAWRVNSRLSVNYGIRIENFGAPRGTREHPDLALEVEASPAGLKTAAWKPVSGQRLYNAPGLDWSGRAGFSLLLREHRRTLLRGGWGLFYDRPFDNYWLPVQLNASMFAASPDVEPGTDYTRPVGTLVSRFHGLIGDIQRPRPTAYAPRTEDARIQSYFAGLRQEVAPPLAVEADFMGSRGRDLVTTDLVNREYTGSEGPFRLLNSGLPPSLYYRANQGRSRYDAFALRLVYRARRAQLHAAYTLSRSFDNQSDPMAGDFFNFGFSRTTLPTEAVPLPAFTSQFDPGYDWGRSDFNQRRNLVFYGIWDVPDLLPATRGRWLGRGWRLSGMGAIRSGLPYSVTVPYASDGLSANRADLVAPPFVSQDYPGGRRLLLAEAFAAPPRGRLGNTRRNQFTGPGFWSLDLSASREFRPRRLGEGGRIELRADAFNVFNHANLSNPESSLGAPSFGVALYGRRQREASFPTLTPLSETARQIQVMLRLGF